MTRDISNMNELRERIILLEAREKEEIASLKNSYLNFLSSVNPSNIIKDTLNNIVGKPGLRSTVFDTIISAGAGVIGKKIFMGRSSNFFRKIGGLATQFIVSNFVRNKMPGVNESVNGLKHK